MIMFGKTDRIVGFDDALQAAIAAESQHQEDHIELIATAPIFPGSQGGPLMHVIAAKAVAFKEAEEATERGARFPVYRG